jgi:hypothetical protein
MMLAVLASTGWTIRHLLVEGFLPQPFVFDTNDTFMDWFHTAYWANHPGAYDVQRSIYPPLSFVFLRLFSLSDCYVASPFAARLRLAGTNDDRALLWARHRRRRARVLSQRPSNHAAHARLSFGLPLLFTLERGNLILVCFIFFAIAHAPITRSRKVQALATALTINFKPYLLLPHLRRGAAEWPARTRRTCDHRGLSRHAGSGRCGIDRRTGQQHHQLGHIRRWAGVERNQLFDELRPFLMLDKTGVPLLDFVPSRIVEGVETFVPLAIRSTQIVALACLGAALRPKALSHARIAAVMLGAYLVTQSPGGYTQAFLVFLVLLEPARGIGSRIAVLSPIRCCSSGTGWSPDPADQFGKLARRAPRSPEFGLTIGHFLRPGIIILIVWCSRSTALPRCSARSATRPPPPPEPRHDPSRRSRNHRPGACPAMAPPRRCTPVLHRRDRVHRPLDARSTRPRAITLDVTVLSRDPAGFARRAPHLAARCTTIEGDVLRGFTPPPGRLPTSFTAPPMPAPIDRDRSAPHVRHHRQRNAPSGRFFRRPRCPVPVHEFGRGLWSPAPSWRWSMKTGSAGPIRAIRARSMRSQRAAECWSRLPPGNMASMPSPRGSLLCSAPCCRSTSISRRGISFATPSPDARSW